MKYDDFSDGELIDAFTKAVRNKIDRLVQGRPRSFKDALVLAGNTTLDCSNQSWRGIDFSGQDLSYVNFSNSDLTGCRFENTILLDTILLATKHDGPSCFYNSVGAAASLLSLLGVVGDYNEPLDLDEASVAGGLAYFERADLGVWTSSERLDLLERSTLESAFSGSRIRPSGHLRSLNCANSFFEDRYYKLSAAACSLGRLIYGQLDINTEGEDEVVFSQLKIREASALAKCDQVNDGIRVLRLPSGVYPKNRNLRLLERCYLAILLTEVQSERLALSYLYDVVTFYRETNKDREANDIFRDLNRLKVLIERDYGAKRSERFQQIVFNIIALIDPHEISYELATQYALEMRRPFPFSVFK